MFRERRSFIVHLESLNNRHKHMKVIDAKRGDLLTYYHLPLD
jgi:hypothetical protein